MPTTRPTRFKQRLALRFSTGDGALPRDGCTMDVSSHGLFLNTRAMLPRGTHVLGRVALPHGGEAEVHGIVAWTRPTPRALNAIERGGVGLRLLWAEEAYFRLLARAA
jgi:hypothetical protein